MPPSPAEKKAFITSKDWRAFILLALAGSALWYLFTYPQLAFIDLKVTNSQALRIAQDYLRREYKEDPTQFHPAVVFVSGDSADRYLQKALGYRAELEFIRRHDYEFFFWKVRFYREKEKEEYHLSVSAKTGGVTSFSHAIKEGASRPNQGEGVAKDKAVAFLKQKFRFRPEDYILHSHLATVLDNRTDYTFIWEKKGVYVRWSDAPLSGGAKLLTGATVSGDEILNFNKITLDIPEEFGRYLAGLQTVSHNIAIVFRLAFFGLLAASIFFVLVRRNGLVLQATKGFAVNLTVFIFLLNVINYFNGFEHVLFHYSTTSAFWSYLWRNITDSFFNTFIVTIGILMPCLAGESLRYEAYPQRQGSCFLHYLQSTFFSRGVCQLVGVGYLTALIMIGLQSAAFEVGQRYLGVWVEHSWMTQHSANYFPFLAAFVTGFLAATIEEISFRLFSISFGKKIFKSTLAAVLFASIVWGYGHSGYLVFPMWFRSLEVTTLGVFLSYVFLRYGIIPAIVAHYLFDVFWGSMPYILGRSSPGLFFSHLFVLFLPLVWAGAAFFLNRPETERPLRWRLNPHQKFNLEVLKNYLRQNPVLLQKDGPALKKEIASHGWDVCVVETALEDLGKSNAVQ